MTLVNNPRQRAVLSFIREHASVTRSDIALATGLSVSQVSRITSRLRDRGLITVERLLGGTEGRPTEVLALAGDGRYVIGLDIGGLSQKAVVVNLRGEVVASVNAEQPLTIPRPDLLAAIIGLVDEVRSRAGISPDNVMGLGVGLRAVVDPVAGVITGGPETPGWTPSWID
ncbi:MAG: ROK family transcriptional regulator, partial [Thermomicrobiales bacterium]|nr:ROK family transcriptional regulator [Thermomicrobiales bacterium]